VVKLEVSFLRGVATVSDFLTVGSSGDRRVTMILPWTGPRLWRAPSRFTTCDCHWGLAQEKSPRSENH